MGQPNCQVPSSGTCAVVLAAAYPIGRVYNAQGKLKKNRTEHLRAPRAALERRHQHHNTSLSELAPPHGCIKYVGCMHVNKNYKHMGGSLDHLGQTAGHVQVASR
jgi:hypothetical protein